MPSRKAMTSSPHPVWKVDVLLPGSWRGATAALLTRGSQRLVVDTGLPHEAHLLVKALRQRGVQPDDVTAVVNTHFHIDHVLNNCLFARAQLYASQESYEWCCELYSALRDDAHWEKLALKYYPETHEYEQSRRYMEQLRKLALRWWDVKRLGSRQGFHWIETESLPEGLEAVITSGHVPGHASLIVQASERPAVIAGDALLSRQHEERVLTMIPHNRAQYQRDRALILRKASYIIPGHDKPFSVPASSAK